MAYATNPIGYDPVTKQKVDLNPFLQQLGSIDHVVNSDGSISPTGELTSEMPVYALQSHRSNGPGAYDVVLPALLSAALVVGLFSGELYKRTNNIRQSDTVKKIMARIPRIGPKD